MSLFKNKIKIEGLNIIVQNPIQLLGLDYNQQQFKLELKNPSYLQEFRTPWQILRFNPQDEIPRWIYDRFVAQRQKNPYSTVLFV